MENRTLHTGTVAVIGNGPVGQTAALLLARWGIRVIVLDARPHRDPIGSKALCQQRDILDIWESVGVGHQVADEGVSLSVSRTFHRDTELFSLNYTEQGYSPFPPFVNISQTRTEELLDTVIAAQPLIDVRWDHEVVRIEQDAHGVRLECATAGKTTVIEADYSVMATGSRSSELRRQLGVGFPGRSFEDKFLICDIRTDLPEWEQERRFYFDPEWNPGRQILIHPCPDSTFRIDWQVPGDFDLNEASANGDLDRRIRQIIGDADYDIVWCSAYRFHARLVERMRVGRVLLAGDCAHIVAPFGGRGLNSGVSDAENAAWKIAFVLRGWSDESLLETYDLERRSAAVENLEVTSGTMDFLVPQNDEQRRHRTTVLEAAQTDSAARAQVDSGRLSEPFWYTDSPLTTLAADRPAEGRPPKGALPRPAPGVLIPDAPVRVAGSTASNLRAFCRDGVLVLAGAAVDTHLLRATVLKAVRAPVRLHRIDTIDADGRLARTLDARTDEVWIVRPDGHIAAVVPADDAVAVRNAVRTAVAARGSRVLREVATIPA
ncbi:pentachlorophenol monooxygenase (plasmid) [Rhodococcus rhodochrous]|uniref:FAD-dependent monooxygenase n=1 Tax=Rhodococcus rhodochrous TaxID=1829 RepID=UPI00132F1611|nr:FAD-dependent monooxygenase [Rhodococcus rhodochrous]QHG85480.1 pentachlorophenol monooxygenase [Rhodococcus rhodochrous]